MTSKTDNTEEGTPEGLEDTQAFREALAKGGIWTDENLEKSLDWAGETTSEKAAEGSMHVAQPLTKKEQTDVELSEAGITAETIATITDQVFQRISKSREIKDQELALRTDRQIQSKTSNIDKWIERVEARVSTLAEQQSATDKAQLSRLEEKLAALENKIDATLGAMTTLGSHEARLIHEAHRIIMDRKATEESDDASEPSIYGRMDERSANLHKALREMEPHADKAARVLTQSLQRTTNTRKKFGRL